MSKINKTNYFLENFLSMLREMLLSRPGRIFGNGNVRFLQKVHSNNMLKHVERICASLEKCVLCVYNY